MQFETFLIEKNVAFFKENFFSSNIKMNIFFLLFVVKYYYENLNGKKKRNPIHFFYFKFKNHEIKKI